MNVVQNIKQRFNIIGNDAAINRSIEKAIQVAPTNISVLVVGENGVGKEFIPKIIHQLSLKKHNSYIAVNCGAIPEGTIDSELFGHEKGSFTGAINSRKGYFEVSNKGTIFLDEVGELPLSTQVRLLRILESGEFIKVGSSKVQKINTRIIAATNINLLEAIKNGKFREDLYYRLNTVQIDIPPLRNRRNDIILLFKKFCNDFVIKYNRPSITLTNEAYKYIENFYWPGNVRQLRNICEQISIMETSREISIEKIKNYIPQNYQYIPSIINKDNFKNDFYNERDLLYKILFDMRKDINDLKNLTLQLISNKLDSNIFIEKNHILLKNIFGEVLFPSTFDSSYQIESSNSSIIPSNSNQSFNFEDMNNKNNESLFLQKKELEFIRKALKRNNGRRKIAAKELGISERTLYRKIKQYGL